MKVYDCFTFYNEFELLELRLKTYYDLVDYFVIVESPLTFRSDDKKLFLKENLERFKGYKDKIRLLEAKVDKVDVVACDYRIDHQQRNYIINGLYDAKPEDFIILSDVDEFPSVEVLESISKNKKLQYPLYKIYRLMRKRKDKILAINNFIKTWSIYRFTKDINKVLEYTPIVFGQQHFYYFMNNLHPDMWCGSIITKFKFVEGIQNLRNIRRGLPIVKGGCHFAYMGGLERVLNKVNSTVDENFNRNDVKIYTMEEVEANIKNGSMMYDFQGDEKFIFRTVDVDDIDIENIKEFKLLYPDFFIGKFNGN